jgi:hypothetical protein
VQIFGNFQEKKDAENKFLWAMGIKKDGTGKWGIKVIGV